jgi:hypothetical protein
MPEGLVWDEVEPLTQHELNVAVAHWSDHCDTLGMDLLSPHEQTIVKVLRSLEIETEDDVESTDEHDYTLGPSVTEIAKPEITFTGKFGDDEDSRRFDEILRIGLGSLFIGAGIFAVLAGIALILAQY